MAPLVAEELDISIYGTIGEGLPQTGNIGSVPCYRLPTGQHYSDAVLSHLRQWLPDVIDVHNRPMLAYKLKQGLPKTKVLLTLHSTTFISPTQHPEMGIHQMLHSLDGIIVNSQYLKNLIIQRYSPLKAKTFVNHLGVSLEDFIPRWTTAGESLRSARLVDLGWSDRKIVLYVGRLLPSKGVHHLLEAWPSIMSREPKSMLLIVGSAFYSGDRETSYVRKLKSMAGPFGERVVFLPFVPYPQIAIWYNLADVVAVPSNGEEAFGLVNVEAMASAVPIVAADNGGIPEIVEHGVSGHLIPTSAIVRGFTSSILHLLGNEAERRRMGKSGREHVRSSFRWQHTANRWKDLMTREL
ncbi:Spore coat protein SA [compost metagenome]